MKVRIVKKIYKNEDFRYIPQYKRFLFWRRIPHIRKSLVILKKEDVLGFPCAVYYEYETLYEAETQIERFKIYVSDDDKIKSKEIVYESEI